MAEKLNDLIVARTEQPAPANADKIPLLDSADAHKFRWLSWSGLVARLSALFEPAGASGAAVTAHVAATDPHPTYTTTAEAAAAAPVQTVAGRTGAVALAAADIGGLGGAATLAVGTAAGTVAAGNHAHSGVYDPAGTASSAVVTHAALLQTHGISAFGATLVDDASAVAARATLGLGSAATLNAGTAANSVVQLDATAKLPAVDGSQLTGLPSGISAHSALSGLTNDDHTQYYNQARGDARYSQVTHSHAGTYEPAGTVATHAALTQAHGASAFGASLIDDADAAAARVTLGLGAAATLAIGTTAGTVAGGDAPATAVSTHAALAQAHGISAFGSTLVDDTSAVAARATLGLGTAATLDAGTAAGNLLQFATAAQLPALDGSLLTGLATPAPRIVTVPAATGVVTVDMGNASRVVVKMTQTGAISAITPQNVPAVCDVRYEVTQVGGPWALPQSAWAPAIASAYYVYPGATTIFWWTTTDGGASATLECNAPLSLTLSQPSAAGAITVDAAGISEVVVNLTLTGDITTINRQNIPTNCRIRYEITQGAGAPWVIKDSAWGAGAVVDPYLTATTGKTVVVWETSDGGVTANVNGPNNGAISAAWVRRFGGIKMPATRYFDQSLLAVGSSNLVGVAGRIDLVPWVPWYDQTVDRLGVNVTTGVAGALGRVVIYGANANDEPDALLWLPATDLSLATAAFVEHTQTLSFKKNVLYYIGFFHGSTATISSIQGFVLPNYGFSVSTSTSPGSVIRQTVTYPNAPANFGFIPASHFSASSGPSIRMRAA